MHVVLIGGGHAHCQVVKALNKQNRPSDVEVTLIDCQHTASYSGMVPGCVANLYKQEETQIQLVPLCEWATVTFIHDEVVDIDLETKQIILKSRAEPVSFDVLSMDIGSTSRGMNEILGVAEFSIPTRPISSLVTRIENAEKILISKQPSDVQIIVVGAGAAGIELALCLRARWVPLVVSGQLRSLAVMILDAGEELLPNESPGFRTALGRNLNKRGIVVKHECTVQEIEPGKVILDVGRELPFTHCIWSAGASSHTLVSSTLKARGLDVTDRGWIKVNQQLQSTSHPFLFAAGDCAEMEGHPVPKAGVYAVRAGPVLVENIIRFCVHRPLTCYGPQKDFLKLVSCGDGTAVGIKFGILFQGAWVLKLKDKIDQKFMNRFRPEKLPKSTVSRCESTFTSN